MKNFCLEISYFGKKYNGWQRLGNNDNTIQGKIEAILQKMLGKPNLTINGAGRTDAGVHALKQYATFSAETTMSADEIKDYLNHYLPLDICITSVSEVRPEFHARLSAKSKIYEYKIWNNPERNVFLKDFAWHIPEPLDVDKMRKSALLFTGTHDFSSFCAYKGKKSKVRTIFSIKITEEDGLITLSFHGNGFLYKMVRILAGTLVAIGLGENYDINKIFENKSRETAGITAPPHGLCLKQVIYNGDA